MKAMKYHASDPALNIELCLDERHALTTTIRPIRDEIKRRVRQLLDDLRIPIRS
jgi:hypothetical protein